MPPVCQLEWVSQSAFLQFAGAAWTDPLSCCCSVESFSLVLLWGLATARKAVSMLHGGLWLPKIMHRMVVDLAAQMAVSAVPGLATALCAVQHTTDCRVVAQLLGWQVLRLHVLLMCLPPCLCMLPLAAVMGV